jgi:hypothetical protein
MRAAPVGWFAIAATCLLAASAVAQDQAGRIEGVVLDATSHQPIQKALVSASRIGDRRGQTGDQVPQNAWSDFNGAFAFNNLPARRYLLNFIHQNYPPGRSGAVRKFVEVSASEATACITVELVPGSAVTGRVVDEDGDPLSGCVIQPHPAKNFNQGFAFRWSAIREDSSYRLFGVPPGKYIITAQCQAAVFQPRPLSEGPDPRPSAAYAIEFYPGANDLIGRGCGTAAWN